MAWSGGTFTRANGPTEWQDDAAASQGIEPGIHDAQDNDLATGINQCLNKDGSNSCTGNLNFNNNKPVGISAGTAATPAICLNNDSDTGVWAPAANIWAVSTNGVEAFRITSTGSFGIGVTSPPGNVRATIRGSDATSSNYALVVEDSAGTDCLFIRNDGLINTGSKTTSPYNNTTASAANVFVDSGGILYRSTSALKYKTDIKNATHGLADVLNLRPVTYKGLNDERRVGGLIAEEVEAAGLTEFVFYDSEGNPDALHYGNMVSLAFKAIQDLNAKVKALEARIAELEG